MYGFRGEKDGIILTETDAIFASNGEND